VGRDATDRAAILDGEVEAGGDDLLERPSGYRALRCCLTQGGVGVSAHTIAQNVPSEPFTFSEALISKGFPALLRSRFWTVLSHFRNSTRWKNQAHSSFAEYLTLLDYPQLVLVCV
jgi:hypothetical protein